jgi:hypothetical protein
LLFFSWKHQQEDPRAGRKKQNQKMGYETDFEGELNIRPRLADEFVARFNDVASRRNNVYGDGDEGSFDHLVLPPPLHSLLFVVDKLKRARCQVFGKRGTAAGARVQEKYDNPAWTGTFHHLHQCCVLFTT